MTRFLPVAVCASLLLASCDDTLPTPSGEGHVVAPSSSTAIPPSLFVAADFASEAKPVAEVKKTAKIGDTVVIRGRVGGKTEPFVDGAAVLTLVDAGTTIVCSAKNEPAPWDYCCIPGEELVNDLATLKVLGPKDKVVPVSLKGVHGLAGFSLVTVRGRVLSVDAKNLVLEPEAIFDAGDDSDGKKAGTKVDIK